MNNRQVAYLLFSLSFLLLILVIASLAYKIHTFQQKCFEQKVELGEFIKQQADEINALKAENALLREGSSPLPE